MAENSAENIELTPADVNVPIRKPKKVLHFSDGTLEEYSDDEQAAPTEENPDQVDTTNMGWGQWIVHKALETGNTTLGVCDSVGEALASFLGITTPKYQYELEEYMRLEKERKEEEANVQGWLNPSEENNINATVETEQPANGGPTAV